MNKKILTLSLCTASMLFASDATLGTITVKEKVDTQVVENVSNEEVKSADLAEVLHNNVSSINLIRRSGIANDIVLRGQKRDNINVTIDDAKIFGACPNRMDPPTSHVLTSNIESVKVSEGPYDVENFGALSGSVKVETKKPTDGVHGEAYVNAGSFGYKKVGATVSGGTKDVKLMITGSKEQSGQYKDGAGNTMAEQTALANTITDPSKNPEYQDSYEDMDAFKKMTFMAKTFINVTDNQDLELSYTKNRSDDVLYPSTSMDAITDDSDIINARYEIRELNKFSKKLEVKAYNSKVDHPMSNMYRVNSNMMEMTNALTTKATGTKIINETDIAGDTLTLGLDSNTRNWDGDYSKNYGVYLTDSINNVDTKNRAVFAKYNKDISNLNVELGARYNDTTISTDEAGYSDRDFNSVDANIFATYKTANDAKYFVGIGKASRVPDGRELYIKSKNAGMTGTPTLNQTTNKEIDFGAQKNYANAYVKFKAFYSQLSDYIYIKKGVAINAFENIDAKIHGYELNGGYDLTDSFTVDMGLTYQKGTKDEPLAGQTDKDLADIAPMKTNLAVTYSPDKTIKAKAELINSKKWSNYDASNGEQELDGYSIVNIKVQKTFNNKFETTIGINNVFDKTYAVSNTYTDLTLLTDGTTGNVMLLNEPGRYMYVNLKYKF